MDRLKRGNELTTPMILQVPTSSGNYNGVRRPTNYADDPNVVYASFQSYGGTETLVDGVLEIIETAQITTWYRPDITTNCRLKRAEDGAIFEILGTPEDIDMRHVQLSFKIRRVKGVV